MLRSNLFCAILLLLLTFLTPAHATVGASLIDAARDGHMPQIKKWLQTHDVNLKDSSHYSAFMWASISGHLDVMEHLLEVGAHINTRDRVYHTPLILAARDGRLEVVNFLIEKGAKLEMRDKSRMTALTWASVRGNHDIMHALVEAGSNIHHEDHIDRTPLDWAKHGNHDTIHDHLLSKGATTSEHREAHAKQKEKDAEDVRTARQEKARARNAAKLAEAEL